MSTERAEWREIPGWEGFYAVSSDGRVKSLDRVIPSRPGLLIRRQGTALRLSRNSSGYHVVWLCRDNKRFEQGVHRLVLAAFVGPCPPGMEACHNDGDKTNNTVSNLRWDTRSENTHDRVRHGTHPFASRTHCKRGHEFTTENTYIHGGSRHCRTCRREQKAARREMSA